VRATIAALEAGGARARYASVDVRDPEALGAVLADARDALGPFDTLVHGAGVLADKRIADKPTEDFERVLTTKVDGLRALLEGTRDDPLRALVLFSSVAARWGNPGQSDYAMANAVLDAVARSEAAARPDARVCALAWGPWEGGMVTPALARHFAAQGVPLIGLAEGAEAFVREARAGAGAPEVVLGAPLSGRPEGDRRFEARFCRATHPHLADHAVKDVPVLPVVTVLDLFARAARALRPDLSVARCREVQVLRGVPLEGFDEPPGRAPSFEVALRLLSNGRGATYAAELRDELGARYRAQIDLRPELPAGPAAPDAPAGLTERAGPLYGGCLFHGERFRVIRALDGVGDAGAAGTLVGTAAVGWPGDGWVLDPALLDGGLQLAVLWTERRLDGHALPTGLGAVHVYRPGPVEGEVRAVVHGREAAAGRAICDVSFVGSDGRLVAALHGVETHVRPGTTAPDLRPR
ncbi:MAG TPA: SDR family oxidoreductase, partial [Sandaracinaceae bacterium LLY-WYZ-13_1]|nr:SDR family oxidoreductase [Sandaracinaceae bacterium LLY-WYZ-13_1]